MRTEGGFQVSKTFRCTVGSALTTADLSLCRVEPTSWWMGATHSGKVECFL